MEESLQPVWTTEHIIYANGRLKAKCIYFTKNLCSLKNKYIFHLNFVDTFNVHVLILVLKELIHF